MSGKLNANTSFVANVRTMPCRVKAGVKAQVQGRQSRAGRRRSRPLAGAIVARLRVSRVSRWRLQIAKASRPARLDIAPEASGLLAASLGLSRMYRNDLAQLDAAMGLYDAFYRWARDAVSETHT